MLKSLMLAAALSLAVTTICACDNGEGGGQKTKGQFESAAGSLTGDAKLKNDGKKDEVVGGVKNAIGDVKDAAHDAAH